MELKIFLISIISLLINFTAISSGGRIPTYFKAIGTENGLPDNSVNVIAEDLFGGIWVGTWNGLARFDGYGMEVYRHSPADTTSLSNNMVRAILPLDDGILVGHDNGMDFFSFADGTFSGCFIADTKTGTRNKLLSRVSRLIKNGSCIYATTIDGDLLRIRLDSYHKNNLTFQRLPKPNSRRYADICHFTSGRLMALSNEGVAVFDSSGERIITQTQISSQFDANLNIFCDTVRGDVYIGRGIGKKSALLSVVDNKGHLSVSVDRGSPSNLMASTACPDGSIAFATDGNGLAICLPNGETNYYTPDNSNLPGDALYTVFSDHNGNLWCGTYRRGLCFLSPELNRYQIYDKKSGITSHDIVTGTVMTDHKLYIALDGGGLDIYDSLSGKTENRNSSNSGLPGNNITSIIYDGNKIWLSVYSHGLVEYDIKNDSFLCYPLDESVESGNKIWTIADGGNNNMIVGGNRLHCFSKTTKSFREITPGQDLGVMSIISTGSNLWVGTRFKGILLIDKSSYSVKETLNDTPSNGTITLPSHVVSYLYQDSRGVLWFSLGDNGFFCIDPAKGKELQTFTQADGLSDTRVRSIVEDPEHNLWLGTIDGLFQFIRSQKRFVKINDSRLPKEYTANAASFSDGNILLGTTAGLVSIPYSSTSLKYTKRPTLFSSINILKESGRHIPLYGARKDLVELENNENFFTISFSVPEIANPDGIQLECLLTGFDKEWRNISESRFATYTNVPPGKYEINVRHANADGEWSEPVTMTLIVRHPWYFTWWALLLWGFVIMAIVAVVFLLWKKSLLNRNKAIEAERERENAKKLNEAKLDFFAGISHELRTPCFLISAQIEEIFDMQKNTVSVNSLKGIYRNSMKLNKLISNIIDFRKMDSGKLKLMPRETDVTELLSDLAPDYEHLCRQKGLSFTFRHPDSPVIALADPDKIEFIVTNLITNAFKYTPANRGGVTLCLNFNKNNIIISVSDSGIGIVKEMQDAIFKPFFRTERGSSESFGDGIGLSFVKSLVELHNGEISVESEVNKGSTFTVTIPRSHPSASTPEDKPVNTEPKLTLDLKSETSMLPPIINNPTAIHSLLIVEDENELRGLLSRAFGPDYRVTAVATGEEGIELGSTGQYDIIITDLMLPGKDGHDLINAVRKDKKNNNIKIIVLSAKNSDEDMLKAYEEGADMYLSKPVSLKMLRHHVEHLNSENDISTVLASSSISKRNFNHNERRFLLRCRTIIDETLLDEDFGIESIARKLAMSHSTLYKRIKRLTGITVIEFINEYRICRAVALFRQGMTNVQAVGELCGFKDSRTFRDIFKRKMNMPPRQYIQTLLGDSLNKPATPDIDSE